MSRSRSDRILDEWSEVAGTGHAPAATAPRRARRDGLVPLSLAAVLVLVLAVAAGSGWLGRFAGGTGAQPTLPVTSPMPGSADAATPTPSVSPSPTSAPAASNPPASTTPTPTASPAPSPLRTATCGPAMISARITRWEGAAGHRIADVTLTSQAPAACRLPSSVRPDLVDGGGTMLVRGSVTPTGDRTLAPGATATTLVDVANYCGADPAAPVRIAFAFDGGAFLADAPSPTDATVPPCNGPGMPSMIQMQPWQ